MALRTAVLAAAVLLGAAPAASAGELSMRVNEVYPGAPGEAFVELLDVFPANDQFRAPGYFVSAYDSAGTLVDRQSYAPPYPFQSRTTPFVLGAGGDAPPLALAPGAGKVCFEGEGAFAEEPHCLAYDSVPAGLSVQRQPCGRSGTAAPTRGQENALLPAVCEGRRPCDDPRNRIGTEPRLKVVGKKVQDVDRFALRFVMNRDGDVSTRGSIVVGRIPANRRPPRSRALAWGPVTRTLKAGVPARIKIPIPRWFVKNVKRGLRRGDKVTAYAVSVARDDQCPPNRFHSSREYVLTD